MARKQSITKIAILVVLSSSILLFPNVASSYQRPPIRPIPEIVTSARYDLDVIKTSTASGEAEKLAFVAQGKAIGISRFAGRQTLYTLRKDLTIERLEIGNIFYGGEYNDANTLRVENSKFHKGFLYSAITTEPDSEKCNYLVLLKQKYDDNRLGKPSKIFQSDCDKSKNDTWGGGLAFSSNTLYLSIGENRISYMTARPFTQHYSEAQLIRKNTYFGKVISISLSNTKLIKVISMGHRNPTGLFLDPKTRKLYESEFGAEGGDEINVIKNGLDYGYPITAFGRIYDEVNSGISTQYPVDYSKTGQYALPLFSYYPSINPMQLFVLSDSSGFNDWRGNILIGCLSGKISRLVIADNRVVLSEELEIGARVRDILELTSTTFLATTDAGELIVLAMQVKK
jgi:glucose/arabinose dehydrogenase